MGGYGGSLKDIPNTDLGAQCVREAVSRAGIEPADVGHVVFGNVIHTDARDHSLARVAAIKGGLPHETPAVTVNRLCGSGLQAVVTAAQTIMLGDADTAVAGGAESMSRSPYLAPSLRWGARMNDTALVDMMVGALSDPFDDCHMGITAENVAGRYGVSREDQDALAVQSHQRAGRAIAEGRFKEQITPRKVELGMYLAAPLAAMVPAFLIFLVTPIGRTVTVGETPVSLQVTDLNIALLFILAMSSMAVYSIVLAGWASG